MNNYISKNSQVHKTVVLEAPVRLYGAATLKRNVTIGQFSYLSTRATLHSDTTVGRYCSVGKNVEIGAPDQPIDWLSTSAVGYNARKHFPDQQDYFTRREVPDKGGVSIGNDVWVGSQVVIMRGVTIGDGAVISAGSVVTRDIAPYAIVAGVPAKEICKRFDDETLARLLKAQWWDRSPDELGNLPFDNIGACLVSLEESDEARISLEEPVEARTASAPSNHLAQ